MSKPADRGGIWRRAGLAAAAQVWTCTFAVVWVGCCGPDTTAAPAGIAAPKAGPASAPSTQPAVNAIALPGIVVDPHRHEVRVEAEICIEQGILEYLAVADEGKTYESLFQLHCRPSQLNAALLMVGCIAGPVPPELRGDFAPEASASAPARPAGAPTITPPPKDYWRDAAAGPTRIAVDVEVRRPDGTWQRRKVESFLIDRGNKRPPASLTWAFTGSFFTRDEASQREVFVADVERSVIALWYDPTAVLNLLRDVGNPYRGESNGLEVNRASLPPIGTPVRLILRAVPADGR